MQETPSPSLRNPLPALERVAVGLILAGFLAVSIHAIGNRAWCGQDFGFHSSCTRQMIEHPGLRFFQDPSNRPLLYWIGSAFVRAAGPGAGYPAAAVFFSILAATALLLLHDALRGAIATPSLRVAALCFLAFLPATVITAVVYAADTPALLPFVLGGWCLTRSFDAPSGKGAAAHAAAAGLAFIAGAFAKATFTLMPFAVAICAAALWRIGRVSPRRAAAALGLAALAPALVGVWLAALSFHAVGNLQPRHTFNWSGTGALTWRKLLLIQPADTRIFSAPGYIDLFLREVDGRRELYENTSHSYPALLHLAVYTDILNFSGEKVLPVYPQRPEPQQTAARLCVALGVLFSAAAVLGVLSSYGRGLKALVIARGPPSAGPAVWMSMAAVWYLPLVAALPFTNNAYEWGYWLPRLVLPALWVFFSLGFALLDRMPAGIRPRASAAALGLVVLLSAAELRSLWY